MVASLRCRASLHSFVFLSFLILNQSSGWHRRYLHNIKSEICTFANPRDMAEIRIMYVFCQPRLSNAGHANLVIMDAVPDRDKGVSRSSMVSPPSGGRRSRRAPLGLVSTSCCNYLKRRKEVGAPTPLRSSRLSGTDGSECVEWGVSHCKAESSISESFMRRPDVHLD